MGRKKAGSGGSSSSSAEQKKKGNPQAPTTAAAAEVHERKFDFPLYNVCWWDNRVVVGGGGGGKFGMANQVVVVRGGSLETVGFHDFGPNIIWTSAHLPAMRKGVMLVGHTGAVTLLRLQRTIDDGAAAAVNLTAHGTVQVTVNLDEPSKKYIALSPNGTFAVASQDDCSLVTLSVQGKELKKGRAVRPPHKKRINDVACAAHGGGGGGDGAKGVVVLTASDDLTIRLWQAVAIGGGDAQLQQTQEVTVGSVTSEGRAVPKFCRLGRSAKAAWVVTSGMDRKSELIRFAVHLPLGGGGGGGGGGGRAALREERRSFVTKADEAVCSFAVSDDEAFVCCGTNEGGTIVLDAATLAVVWSSRPHDAPVSAVALSANHRLASVTVDGVLRVVSIPGLRSASAFGGSAGRAVVAALAVAALALALAWLLWPRFVPAK